MNAAKAESVKVSVIAIQLASLSITHKIMRTLKEKTSVHTQSIPSFRLFKGLSEGKGVSENESPGETIFGSLTQTFSETYFDINFFMEEAA